MKKIRTITTMLAITLVAIFCMAPPSIFAADEKSGIEQKVDELQEETVATLETLRKNFEENRLVNRPRDELVAWVIMGIFAGAIAGIVTRLKCSLLGAIGKILLGLTGAYLGGMLIRMSSNRPDWGAILLPCDELIFSLGGAVVLILLGRAIGLISKKRQPVRSD